MKSRSRWVFVAIAAGMLGGCSSPDAAKNERVSSVNYIEAAEVETQATAAAAPLASPPEIAADGDTDELYVRPAAIPAEMRGLIKAEEKENEHCRGGSGDDPGTMRACNRRQVLLKSLEDAGLCWGGASFGADMHWIRCKDDKTYEPGHYDQPYYNEAEIAEVANGM